MESVNGEDGAMMRFFNHIFMVRSKELSVLADNSERDAMVTRWVRIGDNNTTNIPIALLVFFVAAQLKTLDTTFLIALVWGDPCNNAL